MNVGSAAERQEQVQAELAARYPRLNTLLGTQLRERAGQPDALVNPLVFSLCAGSFLVDRWEWALAGFSDSQLRQHFRARRFGQLDHASDFDAGLNAMLAELDALDDFRVARPKTNVELISEGSTRGADFIARWDNTAAIVEVKRADGLTRELWVARAVVQAWQLLYPDIADLSIDLWASEAYHNQRLEGGVTPKDRSALQDRLRHLVYDDDGRKLAQALAGPAPVALVEGTFYVQRSNDPPGVHVSPFWEVHDNRVEQMAPDMERRMAIAMSCLRGLAYVAYEIRTALPQLYATANTSNSEVLLVPYVNCAGQELDGIHPLTWAAGLGDVLHWDRRVELLLRLPIRREPWCFAREPNGSLVGLNNMHAWLAHPRR